MYTVVIGVLPPYKGRVAETFKREGERERQGATPVKLCKGETEGWKRNGWVESKVEDRRGPKSKRNQLDIGARR